MKRTQHIKISKMRLNGSLLAFSLLVVLSCEDFIEVDPPSSVIVGETVFTDDATAAAAIVGIYSDLINIQFGIGNGGPTLYAGLSSDEFVNFSTNVEQAQFFDNSLLATNSAVINLWSEGYQRIFAANSVIEGLKNSTDVNATLSAQLTGEALFIRSFLHFYLLNLYGDIPYVTSTDFRVNTKAVRLPSSQVYDHIISDLENAEMLLADNYSYSNGVRARVNKSAATAMLARVYLYDKDWVNAEAKATAVINESSLYNLEDDLNNVFLPNSDEAIWQLAPLKPGINTIEGYTFILTSQPTSVSLSSHIIDSFEPDDERRSKWVGSFTEGATTYYYPFKYKVKTSETIGEYYMVLRLAEQYLIRAEARAQQVNIVGSQEDLNSIRNRAGLANTTADNQNDLLMAIEQERKIEFFAEWGHRWFDIKRTSRVDEILLSRKPNWKPTDVLYPIPQIQIDRNPGMPQNLGY